MSEQEPTRRVPLVRVETTRGAAETGRTAPRMRLDPLQVVAWVAGLALLVSGLVAVARSGFDDLALLRPVVEVGGLPATPLLGLLQVVAGMALLAGATGEVAEQGLRIGGVLLGVVGTVWLIEPDPFADYLGVTAASGAALLGLGVLVAAASFLPPLSIARPGVGERPGR